MFTQQHYIVLAEVIHQRRIKIKSDAVLGKSCPVDQIKLEAIDDLTIDLMALLQRDNKKFNKLLFIAASSKDLA